MKVAVTAAGSDMASRVDPRFGRAQYFIIVDMDSGAFEAVDNAQNLNAAQGAGIQAARIVAETGAGVVITGNVGPKAFATLRAAGISVCSGAAGSVGDAVKQFRAGGIAPADDANVDGHWA
jgi:predicted Fe-Mo cluster-binding NifX family protein